MPEYRANKTFGTERGSKYGLIRTGQVVTMPESDAAKFTRANPGCLELYAGPRLPPEERDIPGAPDNKSLPGSPKRKDPEPDDDAGNGSRSSGASEPQDATAERPADGAERPSSSARRARASRRKT